MTTTVSAWGKPGAWALESEEHEAMEVLEHQETPSVEASPDFPSLAAAAATRIPKKKKPQRVSLADFTNNGASSGGINAGSGKFQVRAMAAPPAPLVEPAKGLTPEERLMLPTAPRERSAEELELGNSRGFGRSRTNGEDSVSRWDSSSRVSDDGRRGGPSRDLAPSRADEVDDWGANKRSIAPERRERAGGFFESQTRADDQDSWLSNKSEIRRNGDGFRDRRGFESLSRDSTPGDAESWGRRREEVAGGERPRLKLQPRTLPLEKPEVQNSSTKEVVDHRPEVNVVVKNKGLNPFGAARPREEVLAEKGQDWKQIEERLESVKIREERSESVSKKGFGLGTLVPEKTERSWRKPDVVEVSPEQREEMGEEESAAGES
ncbi:glycine-rich protein [Wolffia australiana]